MNRKTLRLAVVLTVVALSIAGGYIVRPEPPPPLRFTAHFDNAIGLYVGNEVAILGMPVGKVTSIEPRGPYVEVGIELQPGTRVPADVTAVTVGTSILTDRHIELTPPYDGGPLLADGAVLGPDSTRTPIEFDRVLKMVDKLGSAMSGDGHGGGPLADLLASTSAITSTSGEQIKSALTALSEALRTGDDGGGATETHIRTIITNLARSPTRPPATNSRYVNSARMSANSPICWPSRASAAGRPGPGSTAC